MKIHSDLVAMTLDTMCVKRSVIPASTLHCCDLRKAAEDFGNNGHV